MSEPVPPEIPDHKFERYVASGGFGDVFAYRDVGLDRLVAVKVLHLVALSPQKETEFRTEASLMAALGDQHDNVVRVNRFATAPDGRPYISMEYCNDHLGNVARSSRMPVHEALRHSIKIASAVDAAHGRGLYHRDIKPANVLVKRNGQPALTDFGIAGGRDVDAGQRGVSLQYGAPEVIDEQTDGEEVADVYSLGATTFALLTGHSPVWQPGGPNDDSSIIERALRSARPSTGRDDVPPSLEAVLARSLAVTPRNRHTSAMAFARALQEVEAELGFAPTRVPFVADQDRAAAPAPRTDDEEGTRIAVKRVDPSGRRTDKSATAPPPQKSPRSERGEPVDLPTRGRESEHTEVRPDRAPPRSAPEEETPAASPEHPEGDRRRWLVIGGSVGVLLLLVLAVALLPRGETDEGGNDGVASEVDQPPDGDSLFAAPTEPTGVDVSVQGEAVVVTWDAAPDEEATYVVAVTEGRLAGESYPVERPELELSTAEAGTDVCVEVLGVLGSASSEPSREVCAP